MRKKKGKENGEEKKLIRVFGWVMGGFVEEKLVRLGCFLPRPIKMFLPKLERYLEKKNALLFGPQCSSVQRSQPNRALGTIFYFPSHYFFPPLFSSMWEGK